MRVLTFQSKVVTSLLSFMLGKWFNTMGSALFSLPSGTSHNLAVASPELKLILPSICANVQCFLCVLAITLMQEVMIRLDSKHMKTLRFGGPEE